MAHQQYASCIEACNTCADACDHCATACLQEDDVKMMARCIGLDIDCAAICRLAAGYMARGSELAQQACRVCAEVCEVCGGVDEDSSPAMKKAVSAIAETRQFAPSHQMVEIVGRCEHCRGVAP